MGYEITVLEGYGFDEVPSYFKDYVLDLYNLKSKASGAKKEAIKGLLNKFLGRFGLNILKPTTKVVNTNKLDSLISTRKINSIEEITKDAFLVNYLPFSLSGSAVQWIFKFVWIMG